MKRLAHCAFVAMLLLGFTVTWKSGLGQTCNVTATATPTSVPCGGGTVDLNATGTGGVTFALDNDFNGGGAGAGWNVSPAGTFNNPCDPSLDGSTYMWMGNTTAAPRTLQSAPLDVSCGGQICFDLDFSTQGGAAPCEGPDLASEGVYLQYSIDGGATFTDIFYFEPNTATNAYTAWANYCFTIPPAAETASTIFQWYQGGSSGTCCDHWGIDNVTITAQSCISYYYDWEHVVGAPDNAAQNGVQVNSDTTFTVWYTNGTSDSCSASVTVTVQGMGAPTIATVDETCLGDNSGQLTITPNGGSPGYTYDITGPVAQNNTTGSFSNLPPGTYNITVTESGGCTVNATAILNAGANCCPMTIAATSTNVSCNGGTDGTGDVTQTGGVMPVTYQWHDIGMNPIAGQTAASATGLGAGQYIVEVTDGTPCTLVDTITITEPAAITFTTNIVNTTCGAANGEITVNAAGGTGALEYSTDGGMTYQAGNVFATMMAGTYDVWVRDVNGCTTNQNATIINAGAPSITGTVVTEPSCNGVCDGEVTIAGAGGLAPYQYSNGGAFGAAGTFTNLCAGTYTFTVQDANMCTHDTVITLTDPAAMTLTANILDNLCAQDCGGVIDLTATGGDGNYQYSIDGGTTWQGSPFFQNLCTDFYNTVVQDGNGCIATLNDSVAAPSPLTFSFSEFDNTCNNACDGYAIVIPGGGAGNYEISWDGGQFGTNAQYNNICAGTYDMVVRDANGCTVDSLGWVIDEPAPFNIQTSAVNSNCNLPDGSASVDNVAGQTGPYTYQWDVAAGSQTTMMAANLIPGNYDVTITDVSGCDTVVTVNVPVTVGNTAQLVNFTNATCNATTDGQAEVTSMGGTAPYTYQWDAAAGNQTTAIATGLGAGQYNCVVTDASGCTDNITVSIAEPTMVVATTTLDTTICIGGSATIGASASGGSGTGYSYLWDDPNASTTASITVNPAGITPYNVIAFDANGCQSAPVPVIVDLHPLLTVQALSDQAICPGEIVGITAIATGGDGGPYSYTWDQGLPAGQQQNVSPAATTVYTVTASDNCETPDVNAQVTITVNDIPDVTFEVDNTEGCTPVNATFLNTTDPSMVGTNCLWDFGDGNFSTTCASPTHSYTAEGCYDVTLTVTSPQGCVGTATVASMVCVYAYPVPDFTFGPQPTTILDPNIAFTNTTTETSTGNTAYAWAFDQYGVSEVEDPSFEFPSEDAGEYEVCLTATSVEGCVADTCQTVVIDGEFILYAPNAFSPDGDGVNDFFFPQGKGIFGPDYGLFIFDRWGELVFESHHESVPWDGTMNGQPLKSDVYVWKIITTDEYSGQQKEYVGHVTLLR